MNNETRALFYNEADQVIVAVDTNSDETTKAIENGTLKQIKNFSRITTKPNKFHFVEENADKYNTEIAEGRSHIFKCKDCGEWVLLREDEAKWYTDHGYSLPKRCKECRSIRKGMSEAAE